MKKTTVVETTEIMHFAEENLGLGWNQCHDIFYQGHETLYSPESSSKSIELEEICSYLDFIKSKDNVVKYKPRPNEIQTYEILKSFMLANNITEMLVLSEK